MSVSEFTLSVLDDARGLAIRSGGYASSDNRWLVPLGGGFGKIFKIGRQPLNATIQAYYDIERPEGAPRWQLRCQLQFLFPEK
jgi:hypothetical protein